MVSKRRRLLRYNLRLKKKAFFKTPHKLKRCFYLAFSRLRTAPLPPLPPLEKSFVLVLVLLFVMLEALMLSFFRSRIDEVQSIAMRKTSKVVPKSSFFAQASTAFLLPHRLRTTAATRVTDSPRNLRSVCRKKKPRKPREPL